MQTKTYFANSVPAALEMARQELGPDAMLLNSRPSPPEYRTLGRLEVIFAWDVPQDVPQDLPQDVPQKDQPHHHAQTTPINLPRPRRVAQRSEMEDIRDQLASLRAAMGTQSATEAFPAAPPAANALEWRLMEAGLSRSFAQEVAAAVAALGGVGPIDEGAALQQVLLEKVMSAPESNASDARVMAFIGPPGRGKTTSLVKLAVQLGIAKRVPVRIYSLGAHVVGAREQLARYAAILGVPAQSFEAPEAMHLAMSGENWKGLALIDTPGMAPGNQSELQDLARFFAMRPDIECHLVLRASERAPEMLRTIERFAAVRPSRLLFTGLDESAGSGAIIEALAHSGCSCSFGATGPAIPDDIQPMEPVVLVRRFAESVAGFGHHAARSAVAGR